MVWFRVDDQFHRGKKVRRLGSEPVTTSARVAAVGLWTLCGGWAAYELSDGFVPWEEVERWDPDRSLAKRLIGVDLVHEAEHDGESGIQFHDWGDWNPTKEDVERKRAEQAERVRRWRAKQGLGKPPPDPPEVGNALHDAPHDAPPADKSQRTYAPNPNPNPNPKGEGGYVGHSAYETLPDTSASGASAETPKRRRGTRIPDPWVVTAEMVEWVRTNTPHVDGRHENAQFVDYWTAKTGRDATKVDWLATWRRWMRESERRACEKRQGNRPTDADWDALK